MGLTGKWEFWKVVVGTSVYLGEFVVGVQGNEVA